jgi:cytochrome c oxidase subunit 1
MVFSGAMIGFIGFGVWSHHMFTTGMGTVANSAFALATMAIAVPTGVKIFNWIGTLWGGQLRLRTPMFFALGFLWLFMMGGFSGIMHSAAPADSQQHNSYFVVAHFHYVLIGGSTFGLLAAILYWFPKFFGRLVNETWGKVSFWTIFVGFNATFFPMHFLGLNGMPRRTWTYDSNLGWNGANFLATIGAYLLGAGIVVYLGTLVWSYFKGERSGPDPWDARTLEWSIPSPPPDYNFLTIPTVHARDAWWDEKRHPEEAAREQRAPAAADHAHGGIHMPDQSWYPLAAAGALLVAGLGFAVSAYPAAIGAAVVMVAAIYLWSLEGPGGYRLHPPHAGEPPGVPAPAPSRGS